MLSDTEGRRKGKHRPSLIAVPALKKLLSRLELGRITITTPAGLKLEHSSGRPGPEAELVLHRWRAIRRLVTGGDIAFAEAYMDGDWSSPDIAALLELAAVNLSQIDRRISGTLPMRLVNRIRHLMRPNDRKGSRRNIAEHYDLGNEFYRPWLDRTMTYSSAIYDDRTRTLDEAQENKLRRIVAMLSPRAGDEVLEIGSGWGALAVQVAATGATVKGITLSAEQLAHATEMVGNRGLADSVRFELEDYRDCRGAFDRIVSVEMLEAVGERYWPAYFQSLQTLLKENGRIVLQAITIDESRYEQYRAGADFIQRHIFPGGMLPTKTLIAEHARKAGLRLVQTECFGLSYAMTLAAWRERFRHAWTTIGQLGFDLRFRRLWEYYLAYCEAGFRAQTIDVGLYLLEREAEADTP